MTFPSNFFEKQSWQILAAYRQISQDRHNWYYFQVLENQTVCFLAWISNAAQFQQF